MPLRLPGSRPWLRAGPMSAMPACGSSSGCCVPTRASQCGNLPSTRGVAPLGAARAPPHPPFPSGHRQPLHASTHAYSAPLAVATTFRLPAFPPLYMPSPPRQPPTSARRPSATLALSFPSLPLPPCRICLAGCRTSAHVAGCATPGPSTCGSGFRSGPLTRAALRGGDYA